MKVRSSVNLPTLEAGRVVDVNPKDSAVQGLLDKGFLVPVVPQRMRDELKPASRRKKDNATEAIEATEVEAED